MTAQPERDFLGLSDDLVATALDEGVHLAALWSASDAEQVRRARLARWQQGTGNERDGQWRQRQTPATRAQDERSAPGSHNSSAA